MPKEVSKEEVIVTQEGTELTVRPLTIRALRKFMEVITELNEYQREVAAEQDRYAKELDKYNTAVVEGKKAGDAPVPPEEDDFKIIEIMLRAAKIALEKDNAEFAADDDRLEDELDVQVLNQILETSGGIQMNDPNLSATPTARTASA